MVISSSAAARAARNERSRVAGECLTKSREKHVFRRRLRLLLLLAPVVSAGCKISDTLGQEVPNIPPIAPAAATAQVDFSYLHSTPAVGGTSTNWSAMQQHLPALDSLARRFDVSAAALSAIKGVTPKKDALRWTWNIAGTVSGANFTGYAVGQLTGAAYTWELDVTAPTLSPPLQNRQVLLGQTGYPATTGVWNLYDLANTPPGPPYVVEWTYKSDVATFVRIELAITTPAGEYDLLRENSQNTLSFFVGLFEYSIIWDTATGTGRYVERNTDSRCWDAQRHDTSCS